jgi:hypothetical protein
MIPKQMCIKNTPSSLNWRTKLILVVFFVPSVGLLTQVAGSEYSSEPQVAGTNLNDPQSKIHHYLPGDQKSEDEK